MAHADRSREEWRRLVATFEASGLSASGFAEQHGVGVSTLKWWRWRLRSTESSRPDEAAALVPFVRVAVTPETTAGSGAVRPAAEGPALELPGGLVLRFSADADAPYVSAVVAGTVLRLDGRLAPC